MRVGHRIAVVSWLAVVCFSISILIYVWREVFRDALYALLLAISSGSGFVYLQRALAIRAEETLRKLANVPQIEELIQEAEGNGKTTTPKREPGPASSR